VTDTTLFQRRSIYGIAWYRCFYADLFSNEARRSSQEFYMGCHKAIYEIVFSALLRVDNRWIFLQNVVGFYDICS
jgi:hypothetical protein